MINSLRKRLVNNLKKQGYITSSIVENAFLSIPRESFVPQNQQHHAYADAPLKIGNGQTISAPHMVAIMCEALDIKPGDRILEIGSGSGYHAAIVSHMVGGDGIIYSIERIESLAQLAIENIKSVGVENVHIKIGDGSKGLPEFAPYNRIYVTCAAPKLPPSFNDQLSPLGKILIPEGDMMCTLRLYEKIDNSLVSKNLGGCLFVPLLGEYGHHK